MIAWDGRRECDEVFKLKRVDVLKSVAELLTDEVNGSVTRGFRVAVEPESQASQENFGAALVIDVAVMSDGEAFWKRA